VTTSLLAGGLIAGAVVVACRAISARSGLPYPVFLVVAGAGISFIPRIPQFHLDPKVVFLGFLPPLVYHAGLVTSPRELRANARPIGLSSLGLVLATAFAVGGAAWATGAHLSWTDAFILGAVVSPTDPVAAISVLNRLGGPPKITTILEGESLVNDGIALVLFSLGTAALVRPTGVAGGVLDFVRVAGGGTVFGLVVGLLAARVRRPLRDTPSQIVVSLLIPFLAYLPADALGLSGVLATLTAGLVLGQSTVSGLVPAGRLRVAEFWEVLVFLLESVLFVLVGFQLRSVLRSLSGLASSEIVGLTVLTVVIVVVVRLVWWLAVPTLRWRPEGRIVDTGGVPWQERLVLGWSGLRGALSLAAALSIPFQVHARAYRARDLVIFVTFSVVVLTLVGQGTSMPWLLRATGLAGSIEERQQRVLALRRCVEAALRGLDELAAQQEVSDGLAETLRSLYERRLDRVRSNQGTAPEAGDSLPEVQRRLLAVQQGVLRQLHQDGEISFTVMRQVRRELDLEHASLGP
jgi:Na+/H+ antiporter